MDTIYTIVRWLNLICSVTAFWVVTYKGARHWTLAHRDPNYNWAMVLLGAWSFLTSYGTSEQLAMDIRPGPRTFFTLGVAAATLYYAIHIRVPDPNSKETL